MARRDRTTALPRARARARAAQSKSLFGLSMDDGLLRIGIIGGSVLLLLAIIGVLAYRIYDDRIGRPNSVVLKVGAEEVTLGYYTDRLGSYIQENQSQNTTLGILEEDLLQKLTTESLTIELAKDRGITVTDDDITQSIAAEFGVPAGGSGSAFDNLYRQRLKTTHMSDESYRHLVRAQVANNKLLDALKKDIGDSGDQYTLRTIITSSKEDADAVLAQIKGGQDMGTLAQTKSTDLQGRQQDGLQDPEPLALLPESVRTAADGKNAGDLLGPVQVQDNWWVFRIEKKGPTPYSDAQKTQLAQTALDTAVQQKRQSTNVDRRIDSSDFTWAVKHL